jgi:hypothetical protein
VTFHPTRRGKLALGALLIAAIVLVTLLAFAPAGRPPIGAFSWLADRPAPANWHRLGLPDGTAVLSYPPALRPIAGDRGTVSAALRSPAGAYLLYLNSTPRQGGENLRNWAGFRLRLLASDDASSDHEDDAATGLKFRGGTGSCMIDDYVTRIGAHHYREIACLVQGRIAASVVVAAAPAARWASARPLLEQAVAAYSVR